MDLMMFIALGAVAGVIAVTLTRLVRRDEDVGFDRLRGFGWLKRNATQSRLVASAPASDNERSAVIADDPAPVSDVAERIAAHVLSVQSAQPSTAAIPSKRSASMKQSRQSGFEGGRGSNEQNRSADAEPRIEQNEEHGLSDFRQLGERVTAVLTSAETAAAEIRESAGRDAETIRREAEKRAAGARAEAERLRAEADAYREETRGTADAYAAETRRAADAEAAKASAAAEEKARAVEAEAERKAKQIETEALRRRDALRQSAIHHEERIAAMLTTFQVMTSDLEGLLPQARRDDGEPGKRAEVFVDDTIEDALKPQRAVSS